ncbi:phosphotransferase [Hydrogenovibrio halophilus]|uniref:phosphotransferase n=1 Tax=Hydrogenovibrio halophilus TaxID=373391 RepID=UPI0003A638A1|nr:phosphotransferase [Hydrogenovibrio halophilus]
MNKPPAFPYHAPRRVSYAPLSSSKERALRRFLGLKDGCLSRMEGTAYDYPFGFYRFDAGEPAVTNQFFKLLPKVFYDLEAFSVRLEADLNRSGVLARSLEIEVAKFRDDTLCLIRGDFLNFSPLLQCESEMIALGHYLGQLHRVLREHPLNAQCRDNWIERKMNFDRVLQQVTERLKEFPDSYWMLDDFTISPSELRLFVEHYPLLDFDLDTAQMVHGDLNAGNVLSLEGHPCVIDYENARYSFFPVKFDLAMASQRLLCELDQLEANVLEKFLCKAYGFEGDLTQSKIALSIRSMAILLENALFMKGRVSQVEWDKFVALIYQAKNRG